MNTTPRWHHLAALAATITILAACSPATDPTPTPTVPPPPSSAASPTPTPTPSPTPTKVPSFDPAPPSEAADIAAVREGWLAYENALDKLYKDPTLTDFSQLSIVTTGVEGARAAEAIAKARELGVKQIGDGIYRNVKIATPTKNANGVSISVVSYCFDPAQQKVVYIETGEPYSNPNEGKTLASQVTMELLPDGSWRAADYTSEFKPC